MPPARLGPAPPASSAATHKVMVSNRGRNTKLELDLRHALTESGIRGFRVNYLVGGTSVDIAFPSAKVAVFVNGCFWHHCRVCGFSIPKTHSDFWARKFRLTRMRDARVRMLIRKRGWNFIEIWEHQIRSDMRSCVRLIAAATSPRRPVSTELNRRQE